MSYNSVKSKILLFEWNAFMQRDLEIELQRFQFDVDYLSYEFKDWDKDEFFYERFIEKIKGKGYACVLSLNFFPVVADVCNELGINYISWVYDSPMHIRRTESLRYDTNHIFVFDRGQMEDLRKKGFSQVYHMPLAVNAKRLEQENLSDSDGMYTSEIGFVGKMYESDFEYLLGPLPEQYQEVLKKIVDIQRKTDDAFVIEELLSDELMTSLNKVYSAATGNKSYRVKKEEMLYALSTYVTRMDRIEILNSLSEKHQLRVYTYDNTDMLPYAEFGGPVKYYSQMPKVFANSKINLNIALKIIKTGIPLRVLDVLGAGGFLITSYKEELAELYEDGKEIVIYRSISELEEKVKYYLSHDDIRRQIAMKGHEKVKKEFNFYGQLNKIFQLSGVLN